MSHPAGDLQRFALKVFLEPDPDLDVRAFIPIFHQWIRTDAVDGLLIDVADYTHLADGPAVLLAGHEANYAIDRADGRTGLCYHRKQPAGGALADRLAAACRALLKAGVLLESDPPVGARCRFRGDALQFTANDRLLAPPAPDTVDALRPALDALLRMLFADDARDVHGQADPPRRVTLTLRSNRNAPIGTLGDRLA